MSNYFRRLPNLDYPSLLNSRESNTDYVQTKNLFRRVKVREDLFSNFVQFDRYKVEGDERPDNVSETVYGKDTLDWVILLSNNIINVQDEWPMGQYDFQRYLDNKYTRDQLGEIHHYETNEVRNLNGILLLQEGLVVDADYTFKYSENDGTVQTVSSIKSVTNIQYEIDKNDAKRSINTLRKKYLGIIIDDMKQIMTYTDSSQFVNRKLKKGDNLRIAEPR